MPTVNESAHQLNRVGPPATLRALFAPVSVNLWLRS